MAEYLATENFYYQVKDMSQTYFERITFDLQIMDGRACIRGMRITVSLVLSLIANDMTTEEILKEYPDLEAEDIKACLRYAAFLSDEKVHSLNPISVLNF